MPKPIRETIGECACPICDRLVDVREDSTGKLYLMCLTSDDYDGCGKLTPNLPGGQAWIRAQMRRLDAPRPGRATFRAKAPAVAAAPVVPAPAAEPSPAPVPADTTPAPAAKPSVFNKLWNASL